MERINTITRRDNPTISITKIKGYIPVSMLDWDGKLVTTIFLGGCNLNCPYCHNYILAREPDRFEDVSWKKIEDHLKKKRGWIDGCVITGGEPLTNHGIHYLVSIIKELGFSVKLDTNGTLPEALSQIINEKLVDYIAMDIKTSPEKYSFVVKKPINFEDIYKSIEILIKANIDYEFRTTVVPGLVEKEDIEKISTIIKNSKRYFLQQYNPCNTDSEEMRNLTPLDKAELEKFAIIASKYLPTYLRGA